MNLDTIFIKEKDEFLKINKFIRNVFNTESALPEQVFAKNFSNYLFEEFDWTMNGEFWDFIKTLADKTGDSQVFSVVIDPNQLDYFYKEFNYFNCVKLPVCLENSQYFEVLELGPKGSPADAILYNSNIVVWTSPSMKWGVWGQRQYGTCIMAFNKDLKIDDLMPYFKSWKSADKALESWVAMNFSNQRIPEEFMKIFCMNYSMG